MTVFVYIAGREEGPCKIGISKNPVGRAKELQPGCPFPIEVFHQVPFGSFGEAWKEEQWFHSSYPDKRLIGEWFAVTPEEAMGWFHPLEWNRQKAQIAGAES